MVLYREDAKEYKIQHIFMIKKPLRTQNILKTVH